MVGDDGKQSLDEGHASSRRILLEHRVLLDRIAATLLERATTDRVDIDLLAEGKDLPPVASPPPSPPTAVATAPRPEREAQRTPILGVPPAEPMGA